MSSQNTRHRQHLWIPQEEVVNVANNPTGRNEDRGVIPAEHGSKLSVGLQNILTVYDRLKTGDSLSEEDIMVFKLILPEGEKISNSERRKFIEAEGMIINAVKDERHAIVTAKRPLFDRLQTRVNGYKNSGRIKNYQYIDGFEPLLVEDKQAASLKQYLEKVRLENISVDIQMMFVPRLDASVQEKAETKLVNRILQAQGTLPSKPYRLSDGTTVIRAQVPVNMINEISNDTVICRVEQTRFFLNLAPSIVSSLGDTLSIDPNIDVDSLPVVAVLDNGIQFPTELSSLIITHWIATGCNPGDASHGTPVASKVVFSHIGMQIFQDLITPRARVIDCTVMNDQPVPEDAMIHRIQEAVANFKDIAQIYNLSANVDEPIDGDVISIIGYELDALMLKHRVKFVLSAGNHHLGLVSNSLKEILDDDITRIAAPADSILGITVGAIAGVDHTDSYSQLGMITPYARKGPGFAGFRKPDLVAFGATTRPDGTVPRDPYSIMLGANGNMISEAGTSFTSPVVAGDLAEISQIVPGSDVMLAEALLYHGAQQLWTKEKMGKDEAEFIGDCYGRGLSNPEISKYSSPYRVTFVRTGELNRKTKQRVKFHMPTILAATKGRNKAKVIVTCVAQSPIDNTKGSEYLGAYVSVSLHKIDTKGQNKTSNPSVADGRKKWGACYHFEETFSNFNPGSWEVWLELFTRWDIDDEQNIPYSLAVTVQDMTESNDIYAEILNETQGRFQAIDIVRIQI